MDLVLLKLWNQNQAELKAAGVSLDGEYLRWYPKPAKPLVSDSKSIPVTLYSTPVKNAPKAQLEALKPVQYGPLKEQSIPFHELMEWGERSWRKELSIFSMETKRNEGKYVLQFREIITD